MNCTSSTISNYFRADESKLQEVLSRSSGAEDFSLEKKEIDGQIYNRLCWYNGPMGALSPDCTHDDADPEDYDPDLFIEEIQNCLIEDPCVMIEVSNEGLRSVGANALVITKSQIKYFNLNHIANTYVAQMLGMDITDFSNSIFSI